MSEAEPRMLHCQSCKSLLRGFELHAEGGGGTYFSPSTAYRAESDDREFDEIEERRWFCRFLDGYPCFNCGTVDLTVHDLESFLEIDGHELPLSNWFCPVCNVPCLGPRDLEGDAAPGLLLAFLDFQYGAPLLGRLCPSCGRVSLSLHPDDSTARTELANRFPDGGKCPSCEKGHLRVTHLDVPHSGFVGLYDPGVDGKDWRDIDLTVTICDSCGEASVRLRSSGEK
jgi:hypothetical protein